MKKRQLPAVLTVVTTLLFSLGALILPSPAQAFSPDNGGMVVTNAPWMTTLITHIKKTKNSESPYASCSGALISPSWVLTAAHCFHRNSDSGAVAGGPLLSSSEADVTVNVNPDKIDSTAPYKATGGQTRTGTWFVPQNGSTYSTSFPQGDIALVKLASPVTNVVTVTLGANSKVLPSATRLAVVGSGGNVGKDAKGKALSGKSLLGYVLLKNFAKTAVAGSAQGVYDDIVVQRYVTPQKTLSCYEHGDSGGPVLDHPSDNVWTLISTVSGSSDGCNESWVGVTSSVDFYRTWITGLASDSSWYTFPNPVTPTPPNAPTLSVSSKTSNSVSLSWTRPSGATGYQVYQDGVLKQTLTDPTATATMTGLTSNKSYAFQVKATNGAGISGFSNTQTVTTSQVAPGAPTLSTTGKTSTSISLSWTRPSGTSSYTVYDGATAVATTTDPTVTKTITGLTPATTHQYTVKAKNSAGESPSSNAIAVRTLDSYTYSFVSQSASGDLAHARPGQEFTVTLKVTNTGTATWSPTGSSPVLLGTTRPNDRASAMQASGWVTSTRPSRLQESSVAPGGTGTFVFPVKTPDKAGSLTEYFTLVAENTSWFNDAGVSVTITTTPIVGTAARPGTNGQWNVASDGGVFAENGAPFFGSKGGEALNAPIIGIAATKSGNGYWLAGADGGVFTYGDAQFAGSMAGKPLNKPIVGIAGTPSGNGYWLVGADGGVYAYGDAQFYGSMGSTPLNAPVVGIASTPSGQGYWLTGADGGVFAYGDAQFTGSMVDKPLNRPITGIVSDGTAGGYFLVGGDGGIYAFGSAHFLGSAGSGGTSRTTVGISVRAAGYLTIDSAGTSLFYDGTVSTPAPPPPPPPPPAEPTTLLPNQTLDVGARLVSGNGQYTLVMQGDGNLVEYAPGNRPVWASGTGVPGTVLINQSDGNLVLVAPGNQGVWATGTNGNPDSVLLVQDDANVVVYAPGNRPIWASGTTP